MTEYDVKELREIKDKLEDIKSLMADYPDTVYHLAQQEQDTLDGMDEESSEYDNQEELVGDLNEMRDALDMAMEYIDNAIDCVLRID